MLYHYLESGLQNVWLENGYSKVKTKYGTGVAIRAVESLHRVIGRAIVRKPWMTGAELRFLRKQLGLSQAGIAKLIGSSEQTVSLWERRGGMPKTADRLVRVIYLEHNGNNAKIRELIDRLNQLDEQGTVERLTFAERGGRWREAA